MKIPAALLVLMLVVHSGCQQKAYHFAPPATAVRSGQLSDTALEVSGKIAEPGTDNAPKTVGFSLKKVRKPAPGLLSNVSSDPGTKGLVYFEKPLLNGMTSLKRRASIPENLPPHQKQLKNADPKPFPTVWFIILTLAIGGLIYLYEKVRSPQGPPLEVLLLLPLFPLGIIWLFIGIKGLAVLLAPLLGWSVFWTGMALLLTIYLLLHLVTFLVERIGRWISKIRNARLQQKQKEKQR